MAKAQQAVLEAIDAQDALLIALYLADVQQAPEPPCPPIGG